MKDRLISYFMRKADELKQEGDNKYFAYLKAAGTLMTFSKITPRDILENKVQGKFLGPSMQEHMREFLFDSRKEAGSKPFSLNPHKHYTDRDEVLNKINPLISLLNNQKIDYTICGSYRRNCKYVGDIDILIFESFPDLTSLNCKIVSQGNKLMKLKFEELEVDMRSFSPSNKGTALLFYTGPKNFNIWLRSEAKRKGFKLNEYNLSNSEISYEFDDEKGIFIMLGIPFIKPENREYWR